MCSIKIKQTMETYGQIAQTSKQKENKCDQVATGFGSSCDSCKSGENILNQSRGVFKQNHSKHDLLSTRLKIILTFIIFITSGPSNHTYAIRSYLC